MEPSLHHEGLRPVPSRPRPTFRCRRPRPEDGEAVHRLVRESGGLELNTAYAYVLLCDHFASTGVIAEAAGEVVGFVAAYRPPSRPEAVFVWQVGVHPRARGRGLAGAMLDRLFERPACRDVRFLEATVAPSNGPSRRLFQSFAERHGAEHRWLDGYPAALFESAHEPEPLIRVGPIRAATIDDPGSDSSERPS